jgi:hypothetical protein
MGSLLGQNSHLFVRQDPRKTENRYFHLKRERAFALERLSIARQVPTPVNRSLIRLGTLTKALYLNSLQKGTCDFEKGPSRKVSVFSAAVLKLT